MNTITFSHRYQKMPKEFEQTMLLHVFVDDTQNFGELFTKWDTLISIEHMDRAGDIAYYPLPKGKVLVLLLITGSKGHVWTTIRRWTPEKERYYRSIIGHDVQISVK